MASYTDQIPQFNPYIQQLPVEAMAQVGMEKQRRYDEGLEKIQNNFDNIAGLAVARPQDREYLQSKLNELGSKLKTVAAGDFSNYQLVNSVGGMAKQIGKDPLINASVQSSANIKKQQEYIEEEKKKGNLNPANLSKYNKGLEAYYSAGLKDEEGNPYTFSGGYTPYFDVDKFTKETFDAVKPDGYTFEQLHETDTNGNPIRDEKGNYIPSKVATVLEQEGRFPKTVTATLNQIFSDSRVKQQLQISGEFNYRAYSPEMLIGKLGDANKERLVKFQDKLGELNLKKSTVDPTVKLLPGQESIDDQISSVENSIKTINSNFEEVKKLAVESPDAVRASIYMEEVKSNYTTMYGTMKEKRTVEKSELFDVNFRLTQEANDLAIKREDMKYKWATLAETKKKNKEELDIEKAKLSAMYPKSNAEYGPIDTESANANIAFDETYNKAAATYGQAVDNLLFSTSLNNPAIRASIAKAKSIGMSDEEAKNREIEKWAKSNNETPAEFRTRWYKKSLNYLNSNPEKLNAQVQSNLTSAENAQNNFNVYSNAKEIIDKKTPEDYKNLTKALKPITYDTRNIFKKIIGSEGGKLTLTPQMQYDIALAMTSGSSSPEMKSEIQLAQKRLERVGIDRNLAKDIAKDLSSTPFDVMEKYAGKTPLPINFRVIGDLLPESTVNRFLTPEQKSFKGLVDAVSDSGTVLNLEKRARAIKEVWQFNPVAKAGIFTGKEEVDKVYRENIGRFIGNYAQIGANESPGFVDNAATMMAIVKDPKKGSVEMVAKKDEVTGQISQALKFYNEQGQFAGEVTIAPDEAGALGKSPSEFFTVAGVKSAEIRFNSTGNGTTSYSGNINDPATYREGDVLYNKNQFPLLKGALPSSIDVKGNISSSTYYDVDGNPSTQYYNHLYIKNGSQDPIIKTFKVPKSNIDQSIQGLQGIDMQLIQQIISENKTKK